MIFDKKVIIVDDFYPDPYAVRQTALNAEYEDVPGIKNYPGNNTITPFWSDELTRLVCNATGEDLEPEPTSSCGHFRYTPATATSRQIIHFDPKPTQCWAGVAYLSLPEHCIPNAGTKIYSHKRTGMSTAPKDHIEAGIIGVRTVEDMKVFFETEGLDESLWQTELNVEIKFNRLVLFRPWLWHGISKHFGTDVTNSRLTQLIFLQPKGQ